MAEIDKKLNWQFYDGTGATAPVVSGPTYAFTLKNRFIRQFLAYGERRFGINLVWRGARGAANIGLVRPSGVREPLRDGMRVALRIKGGGYVRYRERDYGINLVWSTTPVYEWEVRASGDGTSNAPIRTTDRVGLYNRVSKDFLFYDPRKWGINLKWLRDEGKYNDSTWIEDVGTAVGGGLSWLLNGTREAIWRLVSGGDFFLSLAGVRPEKKMRIKIRILRDEEGRALLGDEDLDPAVAAEQLGRITAAIDFLTETFAREANIRIKSAGEPMVQPVSGPSPKAALTAGCDGAMVSESLYKEAGEYFRWISATSPSGTLIGYAQPLTAIVVREIIGKIGCSGGALNNYITIAVAAFDKEKRKDERPTTLAHEFGHANGLFHRDPEGNLMHESRPRGGQLTRWQVSVIRNSRFVTYL